MIGFGRVHPVVACVALAVVAHGVQGPCFAQALHERYVVVTQDNTQLRSGNLDTYYAVATLKPGTILWADEDANGWIRVGYPIEGEALCLSDAATVSADGRTLTLTDSNGLKAMNPKFGLKGSWRILTLANPVAPGATFKVIDSETTSDGSKKAYKISVPQQARAFVRESSVRAATTQEQSAHVARLESLSLTPPHVLAASTREANSRLANANPTTPNQGGANPVNATPNNGTPVTPVDPDPGTPPNTDPATTPTVAASDTDRIVELFTAFDQVRTQPVMSAEVTPLIAEYEKAISEVPDAPLVESTRAALRQRLALLQALKGIQENRIALENARKSADQDAQDLAKRSADLDAQRRFDYVGKLTTSSVFTGGSQPLLYRIESIGGGSPRTLAYIRPVEALKLGEMLGKVVGVVRGSTHKQSEVVTVVEPAAVELIENP